MSSDLQTKYIFARDVDGTVEEIFKFVQNESDTKIIHFRGWDGFGSSAVLRAVAMLPSHRTNPELCFDRIIYIDCSEWKNRRKVQRAIAEELELDPSVMAILDEQDEEDDYNKVAESSRNEVRNVGQVIHQMLRDTKFMMIFINGSDEEVDLGTFGVPLTIFDNNVLIWTFSRRCLTIHEYEYSSKLEGKLRYTHALLHNFRPLTALTRTQFLELLHQQVATIVARNPFVLKLDPTMVVECCLYELFLHCTFHTITEFNWAAHASNFWICDGIIQGDIARDIANSLNREIRWECDSTSGPYYVLSYFMPCPWTSIHPDNMEEFMEIHAETRSVFLTFTGSRTPVFPNGYFDYYKNLRVLILTWCAFSFASPPFQKCARLRFLGLDHCVDIKTGEGDDTGEWAYICSLLVLDLRYTEWSEVLCEEKLDLMTNVRELNLEGIRGWQYIANLQHRLPNLKKLRIIKPTCQWKTSGDFDNSFIDKTSMEILDLSGNSNMKCLPTSLSEASSLRLLVLDGCSGLENVERLPSSLESFSFNGHGPASRWTQTIELPLTQFHLSTTTDNKDIRVSKISLQGCNHLKNLFLCWLPNLVELDLSETAVKVLDFNTMLVQVPSLKRLFLIGCKGLRAIIPLVESGSGVKLGLELMWIDTRVGIVRSRPSVSRTKLYRFKLHVVAMDARLTRSLKDLLTPYVEKLEMKDVSYNIHVTSSPVYNGVVQSEALTSKNKVDPGDQESLQQLIPAHPYSDVLSMVGSPPMQDFPQPPTTTQLEQHMEIAAGSCYVQSELDRGLASYYAKSLHVHDVWIRALSGVPGRSDKLLHAFGSLKWCCVERCPKLDVFFHLQMFGFDDLEIFWASDILMARWIWKIWSEPLPRNYISPSSFGDLQHLHLRSCPSLKFVLPVWVSSFPSLKTLHIIHCGDLMHVFELSTRYPEEIATLGVLFPNLTTIHLHDLPKLQKICEFKMVAPTLESIKIRGCWSLRRLPSVNTRGQGEKKPAVEIEKDVWDALEWDNDHRPDHFEPPVHSRYYRKKLPRVSVLR